MTGAFDHLMADVMANATRFGHRQHIHLAWLAIRCYGIDEATRLVNEGIKTTARYVGAPQKYHETISRAWMRLVAHHIASDPVDNFSAFASRYPQLLDKRLLTRHYRPATLSSEQARIDWVAPDLAPFPGEDSAAPAPSDSET